MQRDRGTNRPIITANLGVDGLQKLDEVVTLLNGDRYYRRHSRSSVLRRAVALLHAYEVNGVMPPVKGME